MASAPWKALAKQLKEHLQEQQEPFTLDAYLSERRHTVKCLKSNVGGGCCPVNLFKNQEKPCSRKLLLRSTRMLKLVLFKLISANPSQELCLPYCSKPQKDEFQTAEIIKGFTAGQVLTSFSLSQRCSLEDESLPPRYPHWFSSRSCQPSYLDNMKQQEQKLKLSYSKGLQTATDTHYQRECMTEKHPNELSYRKELQVKPHSKYEFTELNVTTKEQLKLGKLLFDCIDESTENQIQVRKKRQNCIEKFMGLKGIEKHNDLWRKNFRDVISSTFTEWNYNQQLQRDIGIDIVDSIMGEIVEEIVYLLL
ncbi:hypothetical protein SLA2020_211000 [Shorea laevis]